MEVVEAVDVVAEVVASTGEEDTTTDMGVGEVGTDGNSDVCCSCSCHIQVDRQLHSPPSHRVPQLIFILCLYVHNGV